MNNLYFYLNLAVLSVPAALSFDKKDSILGVNPFLKAFVERTLSLYLRGNKDMEQPKEGTKENSSSKLILP